MVEVVFVLRGRKVDLDELENQRERAALRMIRDSIRDRVGGLRCPEHGTGPRVTGIGPRPDALEFDVEACCKTMIETTARCFG
jgi:hypothetical protein